MNKKILIVGVLDVPSSTNVAMKKGFEQLGYEVEAYNYRTKIQELGMFGMWSDFKYSLKGREFDLIVFCKVNQMNPGLLSFAKNHGATWYWFMDPLVTAKAVMASEFAKHATYASATASNVVETFKARNENSFHIIEGYDPDIYYYEEVEKIYDIVFIGNATTKRMKDMLSLSAVIDNKQIHIFGSGWPPVNNFHTHAPVYNEEERKVINQSKIVLNLCHDDTIFSDRVVKSLACGARVVSQYCKDLYGPPLTELGNNTKQIIEISEALKLPKLNGKFMAIFMKENYSWKAVCERILEKVK